MPTQKTETSEILQFSNVRASIGELIEEAARASGLNPQVGKRMSIGMRERLADGENIPQVTRLVERIREACRPGAPIGADQKAPSPASTKPAETPAAIAPSAPASTSAGQNAPVPSKAAKK